MLARPEPVAAAAAPTLPLHCSSDSLLHRGLAGKICLRKLLFALIGYVSNKGEAFGKTYMVRYRSIMLTTTLDLSFVG